jgi:hypothetical protein
MARNRRDGTAVMERGVRERGGARTRGRPTRQDYGEQMARPFQRRDWPAPGRARTRRRTRPTGWGNAAVAAAAALAGVLIGAATARRGR